VGVSAIVGRGGSWRRDLSARSMTRGVLLIRADASVAIGTGHVMRCLALAQAWQDRGGRAVFAMSQSTSSIVDRLRTEGIGVVPCATPPGSPGDIEKTLEAVRAEQADWVVVDGYHFDCGYLDALKYSDVKVLLLDDNGRPGTHSSDFILNQNIHARESLYEDRAVDTKLLLGTKYALLRRDFSDWRGYHRQVNRRAHKLLVAMGGSDPDNVTVRVIDAIEMVGAPDLHVKVLVGGSNPHLTSIGERTRGGRHRYDLLTDVTNIPELLAWGDLAVSAAGTVCWEYCLLGLPAVLVAVAENQFAAAKALQEAGAATLVEGGVGFSYREMSGLVGQVMNSYQQRQTLSRKAQGLVDGLGSSRVVSILMDHSHLSLEAK